MPWLLTKPEELFDQEEQPRGKWVLTPPENSPDWDDVYTSVVTKRIAEDDDMAAQKEPESGNFGLMLDEIRDEPRGQKALRGLGVLEGAANVASGMVAFPLGVAGRIAGGVEHGEETAHKWAGLLTYDPKLEEGKQIAAIMGKPFEMLGKGQQWLADKAKEHPEVFNFLKAGIELEQGIDIPGNVFSPREIEHGVKVTSEVGLLALPIVGKSVRKLRGKTGGTVEVDSLAARFERNGLKRSELERAHGMVDKKQKALPATAAEKFGVPEYRKELPVTGEVEPVSFEYKRSTLPEATRPEPIALEETLPRGEAKLRVKSAKEKPVRMTKEEKEWYRKSHKGHEPSVIKPIEFKEPGIFDYSFRPMGKAMREMGLEPIIGKKVEAKKEFRTSVENARSFHQEMINDLYEIEGTTKGERLKASLKNVPTEDVQTMATIVNNYESPPQWLNKNEKVWFERYREYTDTTLEKTNEVLDRLGFEKIERKEAYFPHVANYMAREMLAEKYPFPEGVKYWSEKTQKGKYLDPHAMERKLSDELTVLFTKDIKTALDSMAYHHNKVQLMTEPQRNFAKMLKAYDPNKPGGMPALTKDWVELYNRFIDGKQTVWDELANNVVTKTALKGYINLFLKPINRSVGNKPVTNLSIAAGRLTLLGVLGPRPKLILRNLFQQMQTSSFMPAEQWAKGMVLPADAKLAKMIKEGPVYKDYSAFEDVTMGGMKKAEGIYQGAYQWSAKHNVFTAEKAAYHSAKELIENQKYEKHGWASQERIDKGYPKDMPHTPDEMKRIRGEMTEVASDSQYLYSPEEMPWAYQHKILAGPLRLMSWPMNYFLRYQRSAINRLITGKPLHGGGKLTLPPAWRAAHWKYVTLGGAVLSVMGYKRSYFTGVLPDSLSPVPEFLMGAYDMVAADTEAQKKAAQTRMERAITVMYPGALLVKDLENALDDPSTLLFYKK